MSRRALLLAAGMLAGCIIERDLGSHPTHDGPPLVDGGLDGTIVIPGDGGGGGKIFFVTAGLYSGDLAKEGGAASGPAGGDNICTNEAHAAGLGGSFKAWLSTSTENAKARIAPVGPWRMADGNVVFDQPSAGSPPQRFPSVDAKGDDLFFTNDAKVWTGTNRLNTVSDSGDTCAGWTSSLTSDKGSFGNLTFIGGEWTESRAIDQTPETQACSARLRLYCFGQ